MLLSNVVNNAAAAILVAPIALSLSGQLDIASDATLMAVAIGASCAFLTPIGHQSNALVMEPGGFAFGDYWPGAAPFRAGGGRGCTDDPAGLGVTGPAGSLFYRSR